jgi:hypothetical protein
VGLKDCFLYICRSSVFSGAFCLCSTRTSRFSSHLTLDITRRRGPKTVSCAFIRVLSLVRRFFYIGMGSTRFSSHLILEVRTKVALKAFSYTFIGVQSSLGRLGCDRKINATFSSYLMVDIMMK